MKRSPLKRGASELKRTPLRRVSEKQSKKIREGAKQRARLVAERGNACEVCPKIRLVVPSWAGCNGVEQGRHHLRKQSQATDESDENILLSCNLANGWIEDHPPEARAAGLVRRHGDD